MAFNFYPMIHVVDKGDRSREWNFFFLNRKTGNLSNYFPSPFVNEVQFPLKDRKDECVCNQHHTFIMNMIANTLAMKAIFKSKLQTNGQRFMNKKKFSSLWHHNIISTFRKKIIFMKEIDCYSTASKSKWMR